MFKHIRNAGRALADWLLHVSIYRNRQSEVYFYDVSETQVELDGVVVVYDQLFREERVYGYHFEDRYIRHLSERIQTLKVFSACNLESNLRPRFVVRNNRAQTAYGELTALPEHFCRLLRSYSLPVPH